MTGFGGLPRVTSDSKPFRKGGRLFVCNLCGLVQRIADSQWMEETAEIYRDYEMYHQSTANDQAVFDPVSGRPSGRCEILARHLRESGAVPRSGRLLDVGAGSGAMLAAFSAACEGWRLFGHDLDNRKERSLRAIPQFEQLFTVQPEQLPQQFDLVTLIHSLEHFPDPLATLRALRQRIAPGGQLLVQVNNLDDIPFDLVVADHLCHFTPRSLSGLIARAGFGIESVRTDWIRKEISLLAEPQSQAAPSAHDDPTLTTRKIERDIAWLNAMIEHAGRCSTKGRFGVFGTSVAATWLAGGLGNVVDFFVDEDPARAGRTHLGRPILKPGEAPQGAVVYLAFAHEAAATIRARLAELPVNFMAPPAAVA